MSIHFHAIIVFLGIYSGKKKKAKNGKLLQQVLTVFTYPVFLFLLLVTGSFLHLPVYASRS